YRYRLRRLALLGFVVVLAGVGGAWVGSQQSTAHVTSAATPRHSARIAAPKASVRKAPPERLLAGGTLVTHTFRPKLLGAAAILVDAKTGRVLWEQRAHQRRQVASTTKIMTALLALRKLRPHDIVQVDKSVPRVPLVREGLRTGEQVETWKLMYALLLYSGNDDALALAIAAGGNKWRFIREMNAEAQKLGLRDTHFVSPSGVVDVNNYSSAWDLAALTRVAMRNPRFRSIVRTRVKHVSWAAPTFSKIYINNNRLIGTYPGANGVKTGYTHKSGPCLVASAKRGGVSLIAVVLDSNDMYADAKRLLNFGFRTLSA
ncbi:MAG: Serine-type D-Ala-D-Ala carboxypeptidase, partial [Actinomycetia bacterium]|nr:Serine-type D-Ala-D-Ala carboxypeptidase [Actinomycetes bacterium]